MFDGESPSCILYCYGVYQDLFDEIQKESSNVTFIRGLPSDSEIDLLCSNGNHNMVILDDLMQEMSNNKGMEKLFTQGAHHRKITVVYLNQNMYCSGKNVRNMNLNTHYMILMRNPRDASQVRCLGRQIFPGKSQALTEVYEHVMAKPFGYLCLDLAPSSEEKYRIRTGIFPDETCIVYIPK